MESKRVNDKYWEFMSLGRRKLDGFYGKESVIIYSSLKKSHLIFMKETLQFNNQ